MMAKTHYVTGCLFTAAGAPLINNALDLGLSPLDMTAGLAIGTIAGVLPDIDHPDSMITKGILPGARKLGPVGKALGWWLSLPPRVVGVGARATMNHRGGTHSVLFMMLWTLLAAPLYAAQIAAAAFVLSIILGALTPVIFEPIFGIDPEFNPASVVDWLVTNTPLVMPLVMVCVFCGYLAHLVSDSVTDAPVPWPWPLKLINRGRWFLLPKGLRIKTDGPVEHGLVRPLATLVAIGLSVWLILWPAAQEIADAGAKEAEKRGIEVPLKRKPEKSKKPAKPAHPDRAPIVGESKPR